MKKKYIALEDPEESSITLATEEQRDELLRKKLISENCILLHEIIADTPEEAMSVHYIKLGYKPYIPMGDPELCPKGCGSYFYPKGSGICPNCGDIC